MRSKDFHMKKKTRSKKETFTFHIPPRKGLAIFSMQDNVSSLSSLSIAYTIFELEKIVQHRFIRNLEIPLRQEGNSDWNLDIIRGSLRELLLFVLSHDVDISFRKWTPRINKAQKTNDIIENVPNTCLFSGGVDSYCGILLAKQYLQNVEGVFSAHSDQSRIIHIVKRLNKLYLSKNAITLNKVPCPPMGLRGYAQLRGFLYLLSAAAWMKLSNSNCLIITECGPTMYQPRFSPFDSVTLTTHPVVLRIAQTVCSEVLRRKIRFLTPFENLTKAEVMAISPLKQGLVHTHSCISQRFGTHDGTCYGCIIRRLAAIAAGIKDVKYVRNPINNRNAKAENLHSLLSYSYNILTNYSNMEPYEISNIEIYQKKDLFERFALDNFSAIHRLACSNRRLTPEVKRIYESFRNKKGTSILDNRISQLKKAKFVPRFQ